MKKICALLLTIVLLATQCLALAEEAEGTVYENLKVGNPTPMRGEFFTEMWGNATSDIDVRALLHGYNLVFWNGEQGLFIADPSVVTAVATEDDAAGNRTYTLTLADDLFYSDGSKITAWDYAFSLLLSIAPEVDGACGTSIRKEHILGYQEYIDGTRKTLAGVRVTADNTLQVTIDHHFLPFFYEMGMMLANPYPISVIAPGVVVKDDGEGVYLANEDANAAEPVFTAELLKETVLNPETGYMSHPSIVSGPYTLTSWDGITAEMAINPYFKGDAYGDKPSIPTLTYTLAENDTMLEKLANGEFGLLNKVMRQDQIMAGIEMIADGEFAFSNYPRIGLSYISFACEKDTVKSQAVRQAIAWCMDRDQVTLDYTGNFGLRVDGWYGIGQWMYGIVAGTFPPPVKEPEDPKDKKAQADYEATVKAYEELNLENLTVYTADTEKAAKLLDKDGWKLNEDGVREKDGVVLKLKMIYPEGNNINESFEKNLIPNLEEIGIKLEMEAVPMGELLTRWYKQGEREEDMIYLATNFDIVFDPSVNFRENEEGEHNWAYTNLYDKQLYQAAVDMRTTEPGDALTYMQNWIHFQERFNEVLPMIPVYSNIYFDFYTHVLRNYNIAANTTWGQAIVPAYMSDAEPEEEAAEGEIIEENP